MNKGTAEGVQGTAGCEGGKIREERMRSLGSYWSAVTEISKYGAPYTLLVTV